ncbi:thiol reductant ABC exporter subunit CydC [Saccharibacter floricola]|uniref:Transport ATP-binding protein CydD n=1 Tax=Saccharibacter floricola DSM 15669 TaxID=1123227 RepID=A0ABQ0P1D0_9PROT|nr:thiol reductant ABC exporter subunit CydC [Saccharibacter floricola]GBQ08990.1 transport ATP-binding protein CydD [Saccharibacter floricola DSM 15669]
MKAMAVIFGVWRSRLGYLLLGLVIAELSICSVLLLMGQTGNRLAAAIIGTGLGYGVLQAVGSSRIVLRYLERLITHDAMFRALTDLRVWFYRRLSKGAAAGLGFRRSGDLLSRLVSDVQSLDNLYLRIIIPLATAVITLPIVFWVCLQDSFALACCVSILFAVIAFGLPALMALVSYRQGPALQKAQASLQNQALDLASGLRETRIFDADERMQDRLIGKQDALYALQKKQGHAMVFAHAVAAFLARLGIAVVLCACMGAFFTRPEALVGVTILFVITTALESVTDLPRAGFLAGQTLHAAERVVAVSDESGPTSHGTATLPAQFDVQCEQVTFGWHAEAPVLTDVSLHLRKGERAVLLGPSGSGKSTLAALLLKVASPQKGRILFGGVDSADVNDGALREKVAWLSQSSHLFDDTVRHNLLLGRENFSDSQLWQALEQAQVADFVRSLPEGLDSWIGENGSRLSGGQGRRIALARVLLSSAPLLILDEPAAGLDIETERAFLETLNGLHSQQTILLITHRLTGVERLDHIWRCENGRVFAQPL